MSNFNDWPFLASFFAGLVTFFSPCVLPLIPVYITFITGTSLDELKTGIKPVKYTFLNALFFVLGFSLIFTLLGASATYLGSLLSRQKDLIRWVGGIIIIIFGLHLAGAVRLNFLYREKRLQLPKTSLGYFGSFIIGLAFAIGWTPCVGPILASILILASTQETVYEGMALLTFYALGLGIPLLITAVFINWALRFSVRIKKFYRGIEIASGLILIAVGILLITGSFYRITGYIGRIFG